MQLGLYTVWKVQIVYTGMESYVYIIVCRTDGRQSGTRALRLHGNTRRHYAQLKRDDQVNELFKDLAVVGDNITWYGLASDMRARRYAKLGGNGSKSV